MLTNKSEFEFFVCISRPFFTPSFQVMKNIQEFER